jgi:hypothetical protein
MFGRGNENSASSKVNSATFNLDLHRVSIKEPQDEIEFVEIGPEIVDDNVGMFDGIVTVEPLVIGLPVGVGSHLVGELRLTGSSGSVKPKNFRLKSTWLAEDGPYTVDSFIISEIGFSIGVNDISESLGMVFSQSNDSGDVGSLSWVGDISSLKGDSTAFARFDLGTILVILSCCSTGRFKVSAWGDETLPR